MDVKIRRGVAILVSVLWASNTILGMIPNVDYEPQEAVNGLFLIVVGYLFYNRSNDNNQSNDDKSDGK